MLPKLRMVLKEVRDTNIKWSPVAAYQDGPVTCSSCEICDIKCPLAAKDMPLVDDTATKRRNLMNERLALPCYYDNLYQVQRWMSAK